MDDHSDDIRRPLSPRIEVYAGAGRKRWPDDLKAQIAAESLEPGAIVTNVARRHGGRPQQVQAPGAFGPVGAAGVGGHAVVRAGGVGIGATGGRRAHRVVGSSRCYGGAPGCTSGGAGDAWPCCVE
ncbi:transposase [Bradyrhizobium niftali]|uniref:transposase n=1 Tax=Bradyrhizobium niftali TaxID=2560055 RepID=UPI00384C8381